MRRIGLGRPGVHRVRRDTAQRGCCDGLGPVDSEAARCLGGAVAHRDGPGPVTRPGVGAGHHRGLHAKRRGRLSDRSREAGGGGPRTVALLGPGRDQRALLKPLDGRDRVQVRSRQRELRRIGLGRPGVHRVRRHAAQCGRSSCLCDRQRHGKAGHTACAIRDYYGKQRSAIRNARDWCGVDGRNCPADGRSVLAPLISEWCRSSSHYRKARRRTDVDTLACRLRSYRG